MNSKSAFDYQGVSFNVKTGVNHIESDVEDPFTLSKLQCTLR